MRSNSDLVKGEMYPVEPTDLFDLTIYMDQLDVPAVKSIKWEKIQGGLAFKETSILPGDQILCEFVFLEQVRLIQLSV